MNRLFDLRFVIGLFFLVVGLLLFIYSFIATSKTIESMYINLWCGVGFMLFAGLMLILSFRNENSNDV